MEENKVTKVVTTLTAGSAKPIMVRKADAQSLANAQSQALEEKHEEQVRMLKIKEGEVTTEQPVIKTEIFETKDTFTIDGTYYKQEEQELFDLDDIKYLNTDLNPDGLDKDENNIR